MSTLAESVVLGVPYPVRLTVEAPAGTRNRLTSAFRIILAVPHLILVGAPLALTLHLGWVWVEPGSPRVELGSGGGALGVAAVLGALIAWFAIVITGRHPDGLWRLGVYYLRWRARAMAYVALLTDAYPPFGEGPYPVQISIPRPGIERDRLSVAFRLILALPHVIAVAVLGIVWAFTTLVAWLAIIITGRYPESLYAFGVGVMQWSLRLEAYLLLLEDHYPPFALEG
jgi:hypothetical protein